MGRQDFDSVFISRTRGAEGIQNSGRESLARGFAADVAVVGEVIRLPFRQITDVDIPHLFLLGELAYGAPVGRFLIRTTRGGFAGQNDHVSLLFTFYSEVNIPLGTITQNGQVVDTLRMDAAPQGVDLQREGKSLWVPPATTQPLEPAAHNVKQGWMEESNVNSMSTLVDMISIQRAYASAQKAIVEMDHTNETVTTQIAKPL